MNEFFTALQGNKVSADFYKHDLFGRFIGEWDFEWVDGKGTVRERHVCGEWIFSRILDGTAVQDVFICPSRKEREVNPQPDGEYGTTVRFYNALKDKWEVCYGYNGMMYMLEAEAAGEEIILTNSDTSAGLNQWMFTEIKDDSFHWMNRTSKDGGKTWIINGELFAKRRVQSA